MSAGAGSDSDKAYYGPNFEEHAKSKETGAGSMTRTRVVDSTSTSRTAKSILSLATDFADNGHLKCITCTELGHVLEQCRPAPRYCSVCAQVNQMLRLSITHKREDHNIEVGPENEAWQYQRDEMQILLKISEKNSQTQMQEKDDYIENLKQKTEEAKNLNLKLSKVLEERRETLKRLQAVQRAQEPPQEFSIKEARKTKRAKGHHSGRQSHP